MNVSSELVRNFAIGGGISLVSIGLRRAVDMFATKKFFANDPQTFRKIEKTRSVEQFSKIVDSSKAATEYFWTTGITKYFSPVIIGLLGLASCVIGAVNKDPGLIALGSLPFLTHVGEFLVYKFSK
ncbi:hypothetical protein M1328_03530 [Patescibacteria group bacterium]|nr:hypothetical protein [Patescibacteria group bacterium]